MRVSPKSIILIAVAVAIIYAVFVFDIFRAEAPVSTTSTADVQ